MPVFRHRCITRKVGRDHPLAGKNVYVPDMAEGALRHFAPPCDGSALMLARHRLQMHVTLELGGM